VRRNFEVWGFFFPENFCEMDFCTFFQENFVRRNFEVWGFFFPENFCEMKFIGFEPFLIKMPCQ